MTQGASSLEEFEASVMVDGSLRFTCPRCSTTQSTQPLKVRDLLVGGTEIHCTSPLCLPAEARLTIMFSCTFTGVWESPLDIPLNTANTPSP